VRRRNARESLHTSHDDIWTAIQELLILKVQFLFKFRKPSSALVSNNSENEENNNNGLEKTYSGAEQSDKLYSKNVT